ncbi:MAG: Ribonucleoside-triphosphate reductase class III catalytic subunit [candidate division WS6 bacterium GW2011_GWE1_34_7]|uniref:Ribonucleoside-triphosphate reductase class III catalytic subunit n=1 Tax=candidate division WS6 bacterium GW2011_GWE1_34_7 TaxID=1619093 RepID=A0A0G0BQ50_9BACT|nr:MAG: Ribonucleoside-triphosphate reductase class III catalytic subunit [candidate division WS6 bacterium GW2011_GWE1_34_7]
MPRAKIKKEIHFKVRKRDGRLVGFDQERITTSIFKAAESVGGDDRERAKKVSDEVVKRLAEKYELVKEVTTEEIANVVKETLMDMGHGKTALALDLFVNLRNKVKNIKSLIDAEELVRGYIGEEDWRVKENSNMAYSWQGLNNHISSSVQANYWLYSTYPKYISNAHINADLHIHDLGMLATYCCGWDLKDLLLKGFTGVPGKISSAPAKHFGVALGQCVNFLYTLQHEAAGAQAFSSFDTLLAPFIRYDKLSYEEVKQKIQEFMFNMNVPTRVGCQTPFTNITMDLVPNGMLAKENVIIGGKPQKEKYGDFQKEMDMLNKAFCEVMMEGDAQDRLFSYPIPTYNLTKDFDWDNPKHEPLWEMTAKYGIPYFSNFINSDMSPDDARSMCCRLRLDNRVLRKRGGGLFGANPLTGSIGVVTINMPRIGYLAKDKKDFFKRLDKLMDVAKESLVIKRGLIEKYMDLGLYPYSKFYLTDVKERFGEYFKNHFNTIGILGLNEAMINFFDEEHNLTSKKGREFGLEIMEHMREKLMTYQQETNELFNLEATPGESTTYRFAKADKKKYGDKIIAASDISKNVGNAPYYTNSSQLPVNFTDDIFEALDLQDDFQCKYTGGTVLHVFLGERMPSVESVKHFVKKIATNYKLPYFSITPTFSICPKHGYISGEHMYCPKCDAESGYIDGMPFKEIN